MGYGEGARKWQGGSSSTMVTNKENEITCASAVLPRRARYIDLGLETDHYLI